MRVLTVLLPQRYQLLVVVMDCGVMWLLIVSDRASGKLTWTEIKCKLSYICRNLHMKIILTQDSNLRRSGRPY